MSVTIKSKARRPSISRAFAPSAATSTWCPSPCSASANVAAMSGSSSTTRTALPLIGGSDSGALAAGAADIGRDTTGSSMRKVAPRPTSLWTAIVPPCSSSMFRHSDSPSPVPSPAGLVVKKGSKMRARISAGMPGPLSAMSSWTRSGSRSKRVVMTRRRAVSMRRMA